MDVRAMPELLPDGDWALFHNGLWSGAWSTPEQLVLAWGARHSLESGGHTELAISRFDALTGAHVETLRWDPLPYDLGEGQKGLYAARGNPDGVFLLVYSHVVGFSDFSTLFYALGDLAKPGELQVLPEVFPQGYLPTDILWDGEAFAVHADGGPTETAVAVARVAPDGTLLSPPTEYGTTGRSGYLLDGYDLSFDPTSGTSWAFWGSGGGVLNAHAFDGSPLLSSLEIEPLIDASPWIGRASAHPEGVDLVWGETHPLKYPFEYYRVAQRRDAAGALLDEVMVQVEEPYSNQLIHTTPGETLVFGVIDGSGGAEYYTLDFATGAQTEPVELIRDVPPPTLTDWTDLRDLQMWDDANGRWLAFTEQNAGADGRRPAWRIVRVAPGCVYKTYRLLLEEGE